MMSIVPDQEFGMEAYSIDLRRRVVAAYDRGMAVVEITATFSIHQTTVSRWLKRRARTGTIRPLNQHPGRRRKLDDQAHRRLADLVDQNPDATLVELRDRVGVDCCLGTLWLALDRLGLTYKKRRSAPPSKTAPTSLAAAGTSRSPVGLSSPPHWCIKARPTRRCF